MSKYDLDIEARLKVLSWNATLMSPEIQNELIEWAASLLLGKIKNQIQIPNPYFTILVDEYKDKSKFAAVYLCYFHAGVNKERAIEFVDILDMSASGKSENMDPWVPGPSPMSYRNCGINFTLISVYWTP